MSAYPLWCRWSEDGLELRLHVQTRATHTEFAGEHGDRLKVRLNAPPIDGKANVELLAFLAKTFDVTKSSVLLVAGHASREKRVRVIRPNRIPESIPASPHRI